MNIEIAQCVMIFCFGFFSVLNLVKAAKAIHALQRETDELRNQLKDLDNMCFSIDCLKEDVEVLREAHNNMKKDFYAVCEDD